MAKTFVIQKKRDAAKIRKFLRRNNFEDDTSYGAKFTVGVQVHIWFNDKVYMAWSRTSHDNEVDQFAGIQELYAEL